MFRAVPVLCAAIAVCHAVAPKVAAESQTAAGSERILGGRKFIQVALTTRDLTRAKAFYRDVLGLPLLFEVSSMAFFDVGGVRLMIAEEASLEPGGAVLYFDTPDIDAIGEQLEKRGVTFLGPAEVVQRTETFELKLREFTDPDGNPLALMGAIARR